jgi:anti-sigma regulatory factor (Ser/Thr protein kinase)
MPSNLQMNTAWPSPLQLEIRSDTAQIAPTRRQIEKFAADAQFDETAVGQIGLCVNEALANVIRHAYDGAPGRPIMLTAECRPQDNGTPHSHDRQICVTIRDWGKGHNPADCFPQCKDPLEPGGLGMICMKELMDQVTFVPQPDGMLLVLVKKQHGRAKI